MLLWSIGALMLPAENKHTGIKDLSECHFVHYKSHTNCPGIEPRPLVVGVWLYTSHNTSYCSGVLTNYCVYTHTIANFESLWYMHVKCSRTPQKNFWWGLKCSKMFKDFRFLPQCTWGLHSPYLLQGESIPICGLLAPFRPICFPEISINNYRSALSNTAVRN